MKKSIYTFAFVAIFSVLSQAQTTEPAKTQEPAKKEQVNADGTLENGHNKAVHDNVPASERAGVQAQPAKATGTTRTDQATDKGKENNAVRREKVEAKKPAGGNN